MTVTGPDGLQRIAPNLPVTAVKSYVIAAPAATHHRPASCEEADCQAHALGFTTTVDESTELGQRQAHYLRNDRSRPVPAVERGSDGLTRFAYPPGTRCFGGHSVPNGRPERFFERDGDWRGNPRGQVREFTRPGDWVDSFAEHQQRLADRLERG